MSSRFHRPHECDRQTDRQTDRRTCRHNVVAFHTWHTATGDENVILFETSRSLRKVQKVRPRKSRQLYLEHRRESVAHLSGYLSCRRQSANDVSDSIWFQHAMQCAVLSFYTILFSFHVSLGLWQWRERTRVVVCGGGGGCIYSRCVVCSLQPTVMFRREGPCIIELIMKWWGILYYAHCEHGACRLTNN